MEESSNYVGIDLFSGAGGLTLGAKMAGLRVDYAVEKDFHAAQTYALNNPSTQVLVRDIKYISKDDFFINSRDKLILFGGPPCQGFSTSNQRTRSKENPKNWLILEYLKIVTLLNPDFVLLENVKGMTETEKGFFADYFIDGLQRNGYSCVSVILNASEFGVPQYRDRFFIIGSKDGKKVIPPPKIMRKKITLNEAIGDLPSLPNGSSIDYLLYPEKEVSNYGKKMRCDLKGCTGHLVSRNSNLVIKRYNYIPQGGNWECIPDDLMSNYSDKSKCHTNNYRRLREDEPSVVLGNFRKTMLIHPRENRGLSIREAARLQSFPDWYRFTGSIGFQQQQVSDSVPPFLARAVFTQIIEMDK